VVEKDEEERVERTIGRGRNVNTRRGDRYERESLRRLPAASVHHWPLKAAYCLVLSQFGFGAFRNQTELATSYTRDPFRGTTVKSRRLHRWQVQAKDKG